MVRIMAERSYRPALRPEYSLVLRADLAPDVPKHGHSRERDDEEDDKQARRPDNGPLRE
jgi:hypothetical protein